MPIRPENKSRYPENWQQIRALILGRALHACEGSPDFPNCRAENYLPHPVTGSIVVLTIGHLDHMPENCDGMQYGALRYVRTEESNLRAWCQRCHLNYDKEHHAETRAMTKRLNSPQRELDL